MGRIRVSTEIDVTPARLWSVIEPVETHVEWMRDAREITFRTNQRRGVGTRFTCYTKVGPIGLHDEMTVTEWEPARSMGISHDGLVSGTGRFVISPLDGGERSKFTWDETLHFPTWMGWKVGDRIASAVLKLVWDRNLAALKRRAEAAPS
jgi:Polyketide cyclase / dehydrase and lipid transport